MGGSGRLCAHGRVVRMEVELQVLKDFRYSLYESSPDLFSTQALERCKADYETRHKPMPMSMPPISSRTQEL
jgi:hypothetical protein